MTLATRPTLATLAATSTDLDIAQAWRDTERVVRLDLGAKLGPVVLETFTSRFRDDPPELERLIAYSVAKPGSAHDHVFYRLAWRTAKRSRRTP